MGKKQTSDLNDYPHLLRLMPELARTGFIRTSDGTATYNCIAWAAGDDTKKWDPASIPHPGYYWPPNVPRNGHIDSLVKVFETLGYSICHGPDRESLEEGVDKVALFVAPDGEWSHAARQLPSGHWTSKCGNHEDISHQTPHDVACGSYGQVYYIMKRTRMNP